MKQLFSLIFIFNVIFSVAQTQDTIYFWKSGTMIHKQSIKTSDLDSITFKRPQVSLPSVTICSQVWITQNLDVSTYSDGTPIPQVTDPTEWANLTTGAWCYYNNDPANGAIYGKLYNWYAVAGIYDAASLANPSLRKKLAPNGWHIPSNSEWTTLINCLGGQSFSGAGGKMKSTGTLEAGTGLWQTPNSGATNASGFTGLPGGYRNNNSSFIGIGTNGGWFSSSEYLSDVLSVMLYNYTSSINGNLVTNKAFGFSVRCLRD